MGRDGTVFTKEEFEYGDEGALEVLEIYTDRRCTCGRLLSEKNPAAGRCALDDNVRCHACGLVNCLVCCRAVCLPCLAPELTLRGAKGFVRAVCTACRLRFWWRRFWGMS